MTKKRYIISATCYDSRGRILSHALNNYTKSHPIQSHFASLVGEPERIYLHAEILALLRCGDRKVDSIHIINHNGGSSKPCKICAEAIKAWRVNHIICSSQGTRDKRV